MPELHGLKAGHGRWCSGGLSDELHQESKWKSENLLCCESLHQPTRGPVLHYWNTAEQSKRIQYSLHTVRAPARSCWVNIKWKPAVLFRQSKKSRLVVTTMVVGLFHTAFTWRWCCCEQRCPSLHKLFWPTPLWAWRRTWCCTHQRRPGSSTPQAQTCPGRHPCTWASPSPYRPADQRLDIYILVNAVENGPIPAHLVEPADEAQAARCCLRRVQTRGTSCVVVVDLCRLGDAVQQMVVRYGVTEGQILAHHLENIKKVGHDYSLLARA